MRSRDGVRVVQPRLMPRVARADAVLTEWLTRNTAVFSDFGADSNTHRGHSQEKMTCCQLSGPHDGSAGRGVSPSHPAGGATLDDLRLMRLHSPAHVQVKAAGGIRDLDKPLEVRALGVRRHAYGRYSERVHEPPGKRGILTGSVKAPPTPSSRIRQTTDEGSALALRRPWRKIRSFVPANGVGTQDDVEGKAADENRSLIPNHLQSVSLSYPLHYQRAYLSS